MALDYTILDFGTQGDRVWGAMTCGPAKRLVIFRAENECSPLSFDKLGIKPGSIEYNKKLENRTGFTWLPESNDDLQKLLPTIEKFVDDYLSTLPEVAASAPFTDDINYILALCEGAAPEMAASYHPQVRPHLSKQFGIAQDDPNWEGKVVYKVQQLILGVDGIYRTHGTPEQWNRLISKLIDLVIVGCDREWAKYLCAWCIRKHMQPRKHIDASRGVNGFVMMGEPVSLVEVLEDRRELTEDGVLIKG